MSKHPMIIDFNMPEEKYHAYPAFSVSGIKDIQVSPLDFWSRSWMNPEKENKTTPAMKLGSAYHKRILEGEEAYNEIYAVNPNKEDYPNALVTVGDMQDWLEAVGLKKAGKRDDLIQRVLEHDNTALIWEHFVETQLEGKEVLTFEQHQDIDIAAKTIEAMPGIANSFSGGYSEVSLFWEEDGIPMKNRLDYLRPESIVDLKSFSNSLRKPVDTAVSMAVANNKYHIQGCVYLHGLEKVKKGILDGTTKIQGNVEEDFIEAMANHDKHRFFFIFQQADGVRNVLAREFREFENYHGMGMSPNAYYQAGEKAFHTGLALFKQCMEFFGEEKPWLPKTQPRAFVDDDFPLWLFD